MAKEKLKRGLYVSSEICGKGSKIGLIVGGALYLIGGALCITLDIIERREHKSRKIFK